MQPTMPSVVPPHARSCLDAIAAGLGSSISIGGAFGLSHHPEYRTTHDVDAWWTETVVVIEDVLRRSGPVRTRTWGEVTSIELSPEGRTVFSVQVADRSGRLKPPEQGPWQGGILLDSLDDLVASKMVALVERGAPRDFRDVHAVCSAGLVEAPGCWRLWASRLAASGEQADPRRARLAIRSHLALIEAARPLEGITDPGPREQAVRVRAWIKQELLGDD